jgi:hypothetical protein
MHDVQIQLLQQQELLLQMSGTELAAVAIAVIIGLLVLWIIVSIPVWIAAKILTRGRARFTRAMLVTAMGPIVYAIVFFILAAVLSVAFGESGWLVTISFVIAFIAWVGVFKKGFETGWLRALGIAILATAVFAVIGVIITLVIQAFVPQAPPITPFPLQQA